jgi:uncharacterized protein
MIRPRGVSFRQAHNVQEVMTTLKHVIPDPDALVRTVAAFSPSSGSEIHGQQHWQTVAAFATILARQTPGADPVVALLFGILHDCLRADDGWDKDHGRRAAALAPALNGDLFTLDEARLTTLVTALSLHVDGLVSVDPTVGVCWDADRLHLGRVGVTPDPARLSTAAGRARIEWARIEGRLWQRWDAVWALAGLDQQAN